MRKPLFRLENLRVETFEMGINPMVVALAGSEQTNVGGCTVWTTCSPTCDTTVEPIQPAEPLSGGDC